MEGSLISGSMLGTFYSSDSIFQQFYEVTVITHWT